MALYFDADTGFSADSVSDVRAQVAAEWKSAFRKDGTPELNTAPETPAGQIIDSQTASITQKDSELLYLANMLNPLKATGIFQDALAEIYFLQRKPAIPSSAVIKCTGLPGTVIPVSAQVMSTADDTVWQNTETQTIGADGTCECVFECQSAGLIPAAAGTLSRINTMVAGWDTAVNPRAATVGQNAETQGAFEARRYKSVALNSRGTIAAVYARVADCANVVSCIVRENKTNMPIEIDGYFIKAHSVFVSVVGGSDEDIAGAIYNSCSAGCDYNGNTTVSVTDSATKAVENVTFYRPDEYDVYVKVTLAGRDSLPDEYEKTVKSAVYNNFYGESTATIGGNPILRVAPGDTVLASRFIPSVLDSGISQVVKIQVSADGQAWGETAYMPITGNPSLTSDRIAVEVV
mgnify:FL=1